MLVVRLVAMHNNLVYIVKFQDFIQWCALKNQKSPFYVVNEVTLTGQNPACPSVPVSLAQIKLYLTDLELSPSVPLSLAKKVDFSHDFWALSLRPSVPHAK